MAVGGGGAHVVAQAARTITMVMKMCTENLHVRTGCWNEKLLNRLLSHQEMLTHKHLHYALVFNSDDLTTR